MKYGIRPCGDNSYSVVEIGRQNEFGEMFCMDSYMKYGQAIKYRDELNEEHENFKKNGLTQVKNER
jgi:hypothetical protein